MTRQEHIEEWIAVFERATGIEAVRTEEDGAPLSFYGIIIKSCRKFQEQADAIIKTSNELFWLGLEVIDGDFIKDRDKLGDEWLRRGAEVYGEANNAQV